MKPWDFINRDLYTANAPLSGEGEKAEEKGKNKRRKSSLPSAFSDSFLTGSARNWREY
jgi:hypothetical protein